MSKQGAHCKARRELLGKDLRQLLLLLFNFLLHLEAEQSGDA